MCERNFSPEIITTPLLILNTYLDVIISSTKFIASPKIAGKNLNEMDKIGGTF